MSSFEEVIREGGEEPDDQPDVQGNQAPVDWSEQPVSDDELAMKVIKKLAWPELGPPTF